MKNRQYYHKSFYNFVLVFMELDMLLSMEIEMTNYLKRNIRETKRRKIFNYYDFLNFVPYFNDF